VKGPVSGREGVGVWVYGGGRTVARVFGFSEGKEGGGYLPPEPRLWVRKAVLNFGRLN